MSAWILTVCFPWMIMACDAYNSSDFRTEQACLEEGAREQAFWPASYNAEIKCTYRKLKGADDE